VRRVRDYPPAILFAYPEPNTRAREEAAIAHDTVVVGATGFIGRRLLARLTQKGARPAGFTTATPFEDNAKALTEARTVYFVAGSVTPASADRHPDRVAAHLALFRDLLDRVDGARVVLASSGGAVYDPAVPPPYAERSPVAPASTYGRAKLRMEYDLLARHDTCVPTVLRLSNVYGPGQRLGTGQGVLAHWLDAAAHGRPVVLYGDPDTTRDYVHVDDVVDAMVAVHDAGPLPPVLNIGSGVPVSLATLLRLVEKAAGTLDVRYERGRPFDRRHTWLDTRLARRVLNWAPRTGIEDGIASTWLTHI